LSRILSQIVAATQEAHPSWSFQQAWDHVLAVQPGLANTSAAEENRHTPKEVHHRELAKYKATCQLEVQARLLMSANPTLTFGTALQMAHQQFAEPVSQTGKGTVLVTAQYAMPLNDELPTVIQYMPAGEQVISPSIDGVAKQITVSVTKKTAAALQADLKRLLNQNVRPFVNFDHVGGAAAALPRRFTWSDTDGVLLELDWTGAGKNAVSGRDYSYVSPTFLLSESGDPSGLPSNGAIGSLVNNPAFRSIARIAAQG
jgi:hypothetical protein